MVWLQERSPDAHFTMGKTALHRACEEVCLLAPGVKAGAFKQQNHTNLQGHTQVVELLVAAGADTQMACTATGPAQKQVRSVSPRT